MNSLGRLFCVSVFGASHGPGLGVGIDGTPAGIALTEEDFFLELSRRKPGAVGTTSRSESDSPQILSGVYNGFTTGAPLFLWFANKNARSEDYAAFIHSPRPGHADFTAMQKWKGFHDPRGGGHFSGRLTLGIVAAGVVAKKILKGWQFTSKVLEVGGASPWDEVLAAAIADGDSLGAILELRIAHVPAGLGEPFFDSVESLLAHAFFAIPGVRGVEFGDGFAAARMRGSEHNDPLGYDPAVQSVRPLTNHAGGCNGGITNGQEIVARIAFKPPSSIAKTQYTWNFTTNSVEPLSVQGRHDACFALRAGVVVEAMAAIVMADLFLISQAYSR